MTVQGTQSASNWSKPALHVQLIAPSDPFVPEFMRQTTHSVPLLLANIPAAHSMQLSTIALPLGADIPATQPMQSVSLSLPDTFTYFPTAQSMQSDR